ncbi:hypothetical protein RFF05_02730 [Bengtsoniella intestinalis]|uniref:hypothetical protein n=1 Tax=Bengtsoniella intestinalis TaxID=3073143 RepID=UPI00391F7B3A
MLAAMVYATNIYDDLITHAKPWSKLYMKLFWGGTDDNQITKTMLGYIPDDFSGTLAVVLCAPTGKAAHNITTQTGLKTHTVHSALGVTLDGDHNQLLSVGSGFVLYPMGEADAKTAMCRAGTIRYKAEENVQILSPYNKASNLSVLKLNRVLQKSVNQNPPVPHTSFRNLDRVMVTENDWKKNVFLCSIDKFQHNSACCSLCYCYRNVACIENTRCFIWIYCGNDCCDMYRNIWVYRYIFLE